MFSVTVYAIRHESRVNNFAIFALINYPMNISEMKNKSMTIPVNQERMLGRQSACLLSFLHIGFLTRKGAIRRLSIPEQIAP